ncbi:MAG: hypothetical protein ABI702_04415 [Burkholderiales bacterium]
MTIRSMLFTALLFTLVLTPVHAAPAPIGLFTIVDGDVVVVREAHSFAAAEGVSLLDQDIVRSREGTRLARIELDDGTLLDLGPSTELLLQPHAVLAGAEGGSAVYLLRGWLKVTTAAANGPTAVGLTTPRIGVARLAGSMVMAVQPQSSLAFVETGHADALERGGAKPGTAQALNDGDAFVLRAAAPAMLARRPPADLLEGMPRAFADTLPRRAARWSARRVEPTTFDTPSHADLSGWLHAEPAVRMSLVKRFAPLAREARFRASLVAELRSLPEWGRVLFPDKYRSKTTETAHVRGSTTPLTSRTQGPARKANGMLAPPIVERSSDVSAVSAALAQAPRTETP